MPDESRILTVNGLNEYVKMLIDGSPVLSNVYVRGEISNLNYHSSGHYYFSLKDEGARVSAVMFKSSVVKLKFRPENGMKVVLHGRVSVYPRDGAYQLYATGLEPDGIGALNLAYEQLKRKLESEGLFRTDLKKPLPKIPSAVGIITSPTGAAVRDIINVSTRRFPFAKLILFPSLVQGDGAETDLIRGIKYFNESKSVDVIIIGRGGGSIEDLWAFNSEALAREIFRCEIPVISAVGHETDFTICDFVSDKRAPTPSAAAELALPECGELKRKFGNVISRMQILTEANIKGKSVMLKLLSERRVLTQPSAYIDDRRMALLSLSNQLDGAVKNKMTYDRQRFSRLSAVLEALSPLKVISKGYSAVFNEGGELIKSVEQLDLGQDISFKLTDGSIKAKVLEKNKE